LVTHGYLSRPTLPHTCVLHFPLRYAFLVLCHLSFCWFVLHLHHAFAHFLFLDRWFSFAILLLVFRSSSRLHTFAHCITLVYLWLLARFARLGLHYTCLAHSGYATVPPFARYARWQATSGHVCTLVPFRCTRSHVYHIHHGSVLVLSPTYSLVRSIFGILFALAWRSLRFAFTRAHGYVTKQPRACYINFRLRSRFYRTLPHTLHAHTPLFSRRLHSPPRMPPGLPFTSPVSHLTFSRLAQVHLTLHTRLHAVYAYSSFAHWFSFSLTFILSSRHGSVLCTSASHHTHVISSVLLVQHGFLCWLRLYLFGFSSQRIWVLAWFAAITSPGLLHRWLVFARSFCTLFHCRFSCAHLPRWRLVTSGSCRTVAHNALFSLA